MRDRVDKYGHWLKTEMRETINQKLWENNKEFSNYEKHKTEYLY